MTAVSIQFEVRSEYPCQIPTVGEFVAGETKVLSAHTLELFEKINGYKIGKGNFAPSVVLTARVIEEQDATETEEV